MSHYTVLVIHSRDEDVDTLLAPFDENMETPEYEVGVVSDEEKQCFLEYYQEKGEEEADFEKLYEKYGEEWDGSCRRKDKDGVWREYSTCNPNSKWDWYEIGGRWTGFWKLKDGATGSLGEPSLIAVHENGADAYGKEGQADVVLKGNIDFEGMQKEAATKAGERYDRAMAILGDLSEHKTWKQLKEENGAADIEEIRQMYNSQESLKKWKAAERGYRESEKEVSTHALDGVFGWDSSPDEYTIPREIFVQNAKNSAIVPFAILKDGNWYEQGEMGWFAIVSNEKEEGVWEKEAAELILSCPDDAMFTMVDCHI